MCHELWHLSSFRSKEKLGCVIFWASLIAQLVKNLPIVQETRVRLPGRGDPLEKEMATHFHGESHGWRSLASYSSWGRKSWT